MPVIACPGCGKQYKIAATAAGQVAKCACGKRFRLGGSTSSTDAASPASKPTAPKTAITSAAGAAPTPKRAPVPAAAPASTPKAPTPKAAPESDEFWDDVLPVTDKPSPVVASSSLGVTAQSAMIKSGAAPVNSLARDKAAPAPKKKKKKKSGGIKWGFDWGKVVGGLITFLIFGGISAAMVLTVGRISIYLVALAVVGLFTMLNGLMGEEGIW
jgi:hypothetical protein